MKKLKIHKFRKEGCDGKGYEFYILRVILFIVSIASRILAIPSVSFVVLASLDIKDVTHNCDED